MNNMLYYKVIKGDIYDSKTGYTTILNELVTKSEKAKFFPSIKENCFKLCDIDIQKTYIFFGTRFER